MRWTKADHAPIRTPQLSGDWFDPVNMQANYLPAGVPANFEASHGQVNVLFNPHSWRMFAEMCHVSFLISPPRDNLTR